MAYDKKTWATKEIINVEELNHLEQGVEDAHTMLDSIQVELDAIPDTSSFMTTLEYDTDDDGKVDIAESADALSNNGNLKTYTNIMTDVSTAISTHAANGSAHHARYTNAEAIAAINGDVNHATGASHNYRTDEEIRDVIAAFIQAGSTVTVTHDDSANTLTIAASGLSSADRTKLDGIETGATADMTAAEIIALINASSLKIDADNVDVTGSGLTSEQLEKLNGIEDGATADMTAEEIVALINASSAKIDVDNLNAGALATPIERGFVGEVVLGDAIRIYNPRAGTILSATVISATQPSGESLMVDIRKNGYASTNSIFQSDTPMILPTTATLTNGCYLVRGTLDSNMVTLAEHDMLYVYVTQAGNAIDVSVCLEVLY